MRPRVTGNYDPAWTRANLAALIVLCAAAGLALAWRAAAGRAETGQTVPVHPDRVAQAAERVDPNAASVASLRRLPGIGPQKAQAVVAERENGPFSGADDLQRVRGIGPKTVEKLRPFLVGERRDSGADPDDDLDDEP